MLSVTAFWTQKTSTKTTFVTKQTLLKFGEATQAEFEVPCTSSSRDLRSQGAASTQLHVNPAFSPPQMFSSCDFSRLHDPPHGSTLGLSWLSSRLFPNVHGPALSYNLSMHPGYLKIFTTNSEAQCFKIRASVSTDPLLTVFT